MKLFPPQAAFEIYGQGFGSVDLLGRKASGQRLSDLLERVDDPVVVALDGPWGSGKSHFLKRWVGAHGLENDGKATTVYFDAFANDYLDDPLIALTGAIDERLPKAARVKWAGAKKAAVKLARPLFRVAAATLTAGISEVATPVLDALVGATSDEAQNYVEKFWEKENGRKAAILQFGASLAKLTAPEAEGGEAKPLVVVIDELDRCRPDYALSVLEVIKHFFAVERVHFVLGVNLDALEHMVRSRYGAGVNASEYLKRFISVTMYLPDFVDGPKSVSAASQYLSAAAKSMGVDANLVRDVVEQITLPGVRRDFSLRDGEKLLTYLALLPNRKEIGNYHAGWRIVIVSLSILRVKQPTLFSRSKSNELSLSEIDAFYGIGNDMLVRDTDNPSGYNHAAYILHGLWEYALSGGKAPAKDNDDFGKLFDSFGMGNSRNLLNNIHRDFFGLFEVDSIIP